MRRRPEAKTAILHVVRRTPRQFGYSRSRWQLDMIRETCPWLTLASRGGMSKLLKRLRISYKRGRDYVHSPDPNYAEKLSLMS